MKTKRHKIQTVQDMINCTNSDNLDNFLTDLKSIITAAHMINSCCDDVNKSTLKKFIWIDDGKHEGKIIITGK